ERKESGLVDPFEQHRKRPLSEHIDEWAAMMRNDITRKGQSKPRNGVRVRGEKRIQYSVACVRRIVDGCKLIVIADISASRVQGFWRTFGNLEISGNWIRAKLNTREKNSPR